MTISIFNVRAGRRLLVRRPRDPIQCAGFYQPSIYHHHQCSEWGRGGGGRRGREGLIKRIVEKRNWGAILRYITSKYWLILAVVSVNSSNTHWTLHKK